jgi:serine/threonine protein kinase
VAIGFVAAEPIEAFTPAVLNNISTSVATAAGVDPGNVNVTASAASTRIDIIITTPSASANAAIEENMATTYFSNASAASSVLGLTVTSVPTITSQTVLTIIPPAMSAGLSVPDAGSGAMLTVLITVGAGSLLGGIAAIMLVIRCRRSRAKPAGPMPAEERGAASHGIALEEDFDIVKADRPVRQADAAVRLARDLEAEATIDFVKKDNPVAPASASAAFASATFDEHNPSKNNLLSSMPSDLTPRGAAKAVALHQMIIQATKSSKIEPIPWKDLELLEKLGEGTFGTVHACSFNATNCAVKQLREDRESSAALLADMLQEHDTMMSLRHPNVVLMLGIATDNVQRVGIVLELLEISLSEFLHQSSGYAEHRTWRASLLSIASDVAKGVAYLHFNNLLHRDLKPGNVLLSDSWLAKVADFGSSAKGKPGSAAEGEGIHGTPPYMAPEVARGEAHSAALDVWSFGCLIVHMATLRPPYYGLKCKTAMDIVRVVQRGDVSPVQVLIDDADRREYKCPASILALAKQCCQHDPKQRPDMPAIAGAIASPAVQKSVLKGARDMRPIVRLQRGGGARAPVAVDSQGTYDASHGTYDASESSLGKSLALSPRADAAPSPRVNSSSTISKFRRLSKQNSAAAGLSWNGSAAAFVSTYDATFDGAALTSTDDANKASTSTFDGNSPTLNQTMDMAHSIDLALNLPRSSKTPCVTQHPEAKLTRSLSEKAGLKAKTSMHAKRIEDDEADLTGTFDGTTGSLSEPRSKTSRAPAGLLPLRASAKGAEGDEGSEASPRLDSARSVSSRGSCSTPLGRQLVRRSDSFAHDLSLDMKATFERPGRMTSRRAGCDSARLYSVSSPRAGSDDAFTSTYDASKDNASSSTFDSSRTFDGNSPTFHL